MLTLGHRLPQGCHCGFAQMHQRDFRQQFIARPGGQRCFSRANKPGRAGTPTTSRGSGILSLLTRSIGQPPIGMTLLSSQGPTPIRECPQSGTDQPGAFPREPETNKNQCQILRHNPGALDPKGHAAPETSAAETAIIAIATATAAAVMAEDGEEKAALRAAAPAPDRGPARAAPGVNRSPSRLPGGRSS